MVMRFGHGSVTTDSRFGVRTRRGVWRVACAGLAVCAALAVPSWASECPPVDPAPDGTPAAPRTPQIRVALLLDTSNSMDGLIGQAKAQLWNVVNRLGASRRDGLQPGVQIALYQYGNTRLDASANWIQQVLPFTTDLDLVSEKLFALQTDGGQEYCGAVIGRAASDLAWGTCPGDLNLIFIAGNEPFTQGQISYTQAIADAAGKQVRVNTIFCGTRDEGIHGKWQDGAVLGRGAYSVIDQSADVGYDPTPYDEEITRLGAEVNRTYVPFGERAEEGAMRQEAMDRAPAARLARPAAQAASVERSIAKNTSTYSNAQWDLIDALDKGQVKLADIPKAQLPGDMQALSARELDARIEQLRTQRRDINRRVAELSRKREEFLAKRAGAGQDATLGAALREAIESQAREAGYSF